MNEYIDSTVGHIPVYLLCSWLVTIRGLVGPFIILIRRMPSLVWLGSLCMYSPCLTSFWVTACLLYPSRVTLVLGQISTQKKRQQWFSTVSHHPDTLSDSVHTDVSSLCVWEVLIIVPSPAQSPPIDCSRRSSESVSSVSCDLDLPRFPFPVCSFPDFLFLLLGTLGTWLQCTETRHSKHISSAFYSSDIDKTDTVSHTNNTVSYKPNLPIQSKRTL